MPRGESKEDFAQCLHSAVTPALSLAPAQSRPQFQLEATRGMG